jgi:hypothetical protein
MRKYRDDDDGSLRSSRARACAMTMNPKSRAERALPGLLGLGGETSGEISRAFGGNGKARARMSAITRDQSARRTREIDTYNGREMMN